MESFCDAIREGKLKEVQKVVDCQWPGCLEYKFSFDLHFRMIGTESEPSRKSEDTVDGGKVGWEFSVTRLGEILPFWATYNFFKFNLVTLKDFGYFVTI